MNFGSIVLRATKTPPPGYGHIYIFSSCPPPSRKQYEMMIGNFLTYTYVDIITMMASSLGGRGRGWVHCKHLYFIIQNVMYCGQMENFIHFLTWSLNKMQCLTNHVRVIIVNHWECQCQIVQHAIMGFSQITNYILKQLLDMKSRMKCKVLYFFLKHTD